MPPVPNGDTKTATASPYGRRSRRRASAANGNGPQLVGGFVPSDLGNGERFLSQHGPDVRWNPAWGWIVWTGTYWQPNAGAEARSLAHRTVRTMHQTLSETADLREREALAVHARQSEATARIDALLRSAEPYCIRAPDGFDQDGYLWSCENGTLDLRTGELRPHRREDYLTKRCPLPYVPDVPCPRWWQFLKEITAGDAALAAYLQRIAGLALVGDVLEHCVFILYGTGANGKSVFVNTLAACFGADYARRCDASTFMIHYTDAIRNDLAQLAGARLVVSIELEEGKRLAEALVKQLTGGDSITARFLRREYFTYRPVFTPLIVANHKPEIRGTDYAIWRRVKLVPFTVTFAPDKQDGTLEHTLRGELPGILAWCVQGALAVQRGPRLTDPEAVSRATADYRTEMDTLAGFLEECCELGETFTDHTGHLYGSYKTWAERNGEHALTLQTFARRLTERGFPTVHSRLGGLRMGLRLRVDREGV
jgi:putative DNA primase/helicase